MAKLLTLDELAPRLRMVDTLIMVLSKERMDLCRQVEATKHENNDGQIIRDNIERDRIEWARKWGKSNDLSPDLAATLEYILINESCHLQMLQRQSNNRPITRPESDELWHAQLKKNLLILTRRWCRHYDKDYEQRAFATKAYLALETELILTEISRLTDRELFLDLGCATGRQTIAFHDYFEQSVGYDISAHMIGVANKKIESTIKGSCVSFIKTDVEKGIPRKDNEASLIIMNLGTASDVPDIKGVLGEIIRVLKPGGRFLLSFYNRDALRYQAKFLPWPVGLAASISLHKDCLEVHSRNDILPIYARSYTVDDVRDLLAGVSDLELVTYPTMSSILPNDLFDKENKLNMGDAIDKIDRDLLAKSHGAYIIATGQKPL